MLNNCYLSDISLQDLLQGFFTHYATYDFGKNVLCPITGTNKMKTKRWKHTSHLDMINPLEPTLNVSYNVGYKGLEQFKEECRKGIKKLNILKQSTQEESPIKDGLFWLFKNESAPPERPRLVIPSLKTLDLGSGKENQGGKKSRSEREAKNPSLNTISVKENQGGKKSRSEREEKNPSLNTISVKDYFDLIPSHDDTKPRLKKSDEEKSPTEETSHTWKKKTESAIWTEIDKIHEQDDKSKPSKLLSSKKLSSLFKPSIVQDRGVSAKAKPEMQIDDLQEQERLERLKTKYLRNSSSKSFKHNL